MKVIKKLMQIVLAVFFFGLLATSAVSVSYTHLLVCIQVALIFAPYLDDRSESNHMPVISRFLAEKKSEEGQSRFLVGQGLVPYAESDVDENFSSESLVSAWFP